MLSTTQGSWLNDYYPDYVVFDFETTGISRTYDSIIEISAVKIRGGEEADAFSALVNPGRPIPPHASAVNHITDEMVCDEPHIDDVLPDFLDFIGDSVLVGHNIGCFDMAFLYRETKRCFGLVPNNDFVDTLRYAKHQLPGLPKYSLVALSEHYGLSTHGAHRALNDCRMNHRVYEFLSREAAQPPLKACPRCGQPLRQRNGRFGLFLGCSGYPACRYTENIK